MLLLHPPLCVPIPVLTLFPLSPSFPSDSRPRSCLTHHHSECACRSPPEQVSGGRHYIQVRWHQGARAVSVGGQEGCGCVGQALRVRQNPQPLLLLSYLLLLTYLLLATYLLTRRGPSQGPILPLHFVLMPDALSPCPLLCHFPSSLSHRHPTCTDRRAMYGVRMGSEQEVPLVTFHYITKSMFHRVNVSLRLYGQ